MKTYFSLFLILISGLYGCKSNKELNNTQDKNGTVKVKSTLSGGDISNLSGHVKDLETGESIPFSRILVTKEGTLIAGSETDMEGYFQIKSIPKGDYLLSITSIGYHTHEIPLKIVDPSTISIEAELAAFKQFVEKPVIYLYPTEKMEINVQIDYEGQLVHTYPTYTENGWTVSAEPNGTLWDKSGQEYYALFWEGKPRAQLIPQDGFIVSGKETATFLEEQLAHLGLNRREANEFIMYWLPRMENNPYNFIHFAGPTYEEQVELIITPQPETIIRVMMLTQPLQSRIDFPQQDLSALKKTRKGYTIVEWGGSVIDVVIKGI